MDDVPQVCSKCGATVANSKTRGWVHTEELPRGAQPHDASPVERSMWDMVKGTDALTEQINEARHYAEGLREQMQREEMKGVSWNDQTRHTVMLLNALEAAEEVAVAALRDAALAKRRVLIENDPPDLFPAQDEIDGGHSER